MIEKTSWTRDQLLIAFKLYCQMPFGKMHSRNPEIIKYANLLKRTPSALAMKLTNIASLDPFITSTGRTGLTGASNADKAMWSEMINDWDSFILEIYDAEIRYGISTDLNKVNNTENYIDDSKKNIDYTGKNKIYETNIRIGQNFFRKSVLSAYNTMCCITGLSVPELLIASHIVPWSVDNKNRLNPRNGLCLSMIHDKAFDLGIITITENYSIKVAEDYLRDTFLSDKFFVATIIKYDGKTINIPDKFIPEQDFLDYHRKHIYKGQYEHTF